MEPVLGSLVPIPSEKWSGPRTPKMFREAREAAETPNFAPLSKAGAWFGGWENEAQMIPRSDNNVQTGVGTIQ